MQQGVLSACHARNYELLIHPCQYRKKDIGKEIKTLIEQVRPDGIVLAAPLSNMPKIVRAIEAELWFYGAVLGFEPADEIEPVPIENL